MGQAVGSGIDRARHIELAINLGVAIVLIVEGRVTSEDGGDVPVRVDAPAPTPQERLEIAVCGMLLRRSELGGLDAKCRSRSPWPSLG